LDEQEEVITPEEFDRYRDVWDGHKAIDKNHHTDRKLNKRIDHRHHLIDAIAIALTSRGLFQKMARQYKIDSELVANGERPRLKVAEPPLLNVRELAFQAVKECPISLKPDRYPDKAMFQETAYGVAQKNEDNKPMLTLRTSLATMVDRKKGTLAQAHKAIASIVSDTIRNIVSSAFEARIASGASVQSALAEPIYQTLYGKNIAIKKVCCYNGKYAEDVMLVTHVSRDGREHQKRLIHYGYAYLETELNEGRIVRQELVSIHQAMRRKRRSVADNVIRIHKGDTVVDRKNAQRYRVAYFTAEGNIFLIPITDPRAFDAIKESGSGKKKVSFNQIARLNHCD
jgi:CRISPR-associated endonuclease Csn1